MKGKAILLSDEPRGRFMEGIIYGTPKPGVMMQIKAGVEPVGGRHTWEVYTPGTDGEQRDVWILLPDSYRGKIYSDAYVSGDRCFLYSPVSGEEFNVLVADVAGTADDHAIGSLLIPISGSGKFKTTTGSPEIEPFRVLETDTDPTADHWVWCSYTGH